MIFMILSIMTNFVFADAFVIKERLEVFQNNGSGLQAYGYKEDCSSECFKIPEHLYGKIMTLSVINGLIDDPDRPVISKDRLTSGLESLDSCYSEIAARPVEIDPEQCQKVRDSGSDDDGNTVCEVEMQTYCDGLGVDAVCRDSGDTFEAYCPVPTGEFHKKPGKVLAVDPGKKAAYEAKLIEEESRRQEIMQRKEQRKSRLESITDSDLDSADLTQIKSILKDLVREARGD